MANAFTRTAAQIMDDIRYELRDVYDKQYTDEELLQYINNCCELIYNLLVNAGSELVRTGSGVILTEVGAYDYVLAENGMGDLWVPYRVWIDGEREEISQCGESEQYQYQYDTGMITGMPEKYFLEAGKIYFLPAPSEILSVNVKYYPNFVELANVSAVMPYQGFFNMQIREGVKIYAKNRESLNIGIEASLMQIFQDRAMAIVNRRRKKDFQMIPRFA